jgi:hypothetical protein
MRRLSLEVSLAMMDLGLNKYNALPQWIQSQNGSEFCPFDDLSEELRSNIRQEDKYTTTIHGFRYTVKDYEGKWLVFRRNVSMNTVRTNQAHPYIVQVNNVREIKIMPLSEANEYLLSKDQEYQIFGCDPVKIINNEPFVIMAKYAPNQLQQVRLSHELR